MRVQERMVTISLLEKIKKNPMYAKKIGLQVRTTTKKGEDFYDEKSKKRTR